MNQKGIDIIKYFENFKSKPYLCPAGKPTIGYGHVIRKDEIFSEITEQEGLELLFKDVSEVEELISKIIKIPINNNQLSALVCLVFNIGIGRFQKSTLLNKLNSGNIMSAADEFLNWSYCNHIRLLGLVRRRGVERILFLS